MVTRQVGSQARGHSTFRDARFGQWKRFRRRSSRFKRCGALEMGCRASWIFIGMKRAVMGVVVVMKMVPVAIRRNIVKKDRPLAVVGMTVSSMAAAFLRFGIVK